MHKLLLPFFFLASISICVGQQATSSVLQSGTWYKLAVSETGLYSLSYSDLQEYGINPAALDPNNIAIYGNGGKILPQLNSAERPDDLVENAIMVTGSEDGSFDQDDIIIFYGEGPHTWQSNAGDKSFNHEFNIYSDLNYYFLTTDKPTAGKRMPTGAALSAGTLLSTYHERIFHELDQNNFFQSGRNWYGEIFDTQLSRSFLFPVEGHTGDHFTARISVLARDTVSNKFIINANGNPVDTIVFDSYGIIYYRPAADIETRIISIPASVAAGTDSLDLRLDYIKGSISTSTPHVIYGGLLDYIELWFEKEVRLYGNQTTIRSFETVNPGNYTYSFNFSGNAPSVIDVTDIYNAVNVPVTIDGNTATFNVAGGEIKELVIFSGTEHHKPISAARIQNQNLHGMGSAELIIVSHPDFMTEAERLADFRRTFDGLEVVVANTEQVYNEFSSGKGDATAIRDFARMIYDRKSATDSLRYLVLLGDASYDYKDRLAGNTNYVPMYQSRQSIHPLQTYGSDDYFGFMEPGEGMWDETSTGNHSLDISVGRLPVKSSQEAKDIVDKLINYSSSKETFGPWRSQVTYLTDDGDRNLHINDSEKHTKYVSQNFPEITYHKIHVDSYDYIVIEGKERIPKASADIKKALNEGTLIFNFVGHGGYTGITSEAVFIDGDIPHLNNEKLPFFITATCGFATLDNPAYVSIGEMIMLKKGGGAIANLSGTRAAYSTGNFKVNTEIYKHIFNRSYRIGDAIRLTKNNSHWGVFNRHFTFLGDPSMRLLLPPLKVNLLSKNGEAIIVSDTLKALSKITFSGEIIEDDGTRAADFDGEIDLILYDKEEYDTTKGLSNGYEGVGTPAKVPYLVQKNILSSVKGTVTAGLFTVELMVPLQAADSIGSAKILMYAVNNDKSIDALGGNLNFKSGGIDTSAVDDAEPPQIQLSFDPNSYIRNDTLLPNAILYADLFDENGINLSSSDTSNILLSILKDDSIIYMNNSYVPAVNSINSGRVIYQFADLPAGNFTLELNASDNYNNRNSKRIDFIVFDTILVINAPVLSQWLKVSAYPNPFSDNTTIELNTETLLNLSMAIYTMKGERIKSLSNLSLNTGIKWDGCDDTGKRVEKGIYACKIYGDATDGRKQHTVMLVVH